MRLKDIAGQRFGLWTAIEYVPQRRLWLCECACGSQRHLHGPALRVGDHDSCGCSNSRSKPLVGGHRLSAERFEGYAYPDPNSGCFIWGGPETKNGYGAFSVKKPGAKRSHEIPAHRVAWLLAGRELPIEPFILRHLCNTRLCVNVDHLAVGTRVDNNADIAIAERRPRGRWGRGVVKRGDRFRAVCKELGSKKSRIIGIFDTPEAAAEAVRVARAKMFADRGIKLVYPAP